MRRNRWWHRGLGIIYHPAIRNWLPSVRRTKPTERKHIGNVRQTALDAGAFGFLAKPFEDEALVQLIHKAVAG
jgi:CheY-like chemotaxis protein